MRAKQRDILSVVAWGILAFGLVHEAFLLSSPGSHVFVKAFDDTVQLLGPLLALPLCFGWLLSRRQGDWRANAVPFWLGLAVLTDTIAEGIWWYYEVVAGQNVPFPSLDDAFFMTTYLCLTVGILLLPAAPVSRAGRVRLLVDGLMTTLAIFALTWYFVIGPTLLAASESLLAKVVGTAYPVWDLVLLICLLAMWGRTGADPLLRRIVAILTLAVLCYVAADLVFDYGTLNNTYQSGSVIDAGWPLSDLLFGLAAATYWLRYLRSDRHETNEVVGARPISRDPFSWLPLLPYALLPAVALEVLSVAKAGGSPVLQMGTYAAAAALLALVIARQVFQVAETRNLSARLAATLAATVTSAEELRALNDQLRTTHQMLEEKNAELQEAHDRLLSMATTDPLTGLPNHGQIATAIDRELERAARAGSDSALLFLDLDHFKLLNDSTGHQAGDETLREFAQVVTGVLRSVDILGRWGGEEFVAILPDTNLETAYLVAERVRTAVAGHVFAAGAGLRVTCSIGAAAVTADGYARSPLIERADRAMYAAKKLGRNQVRTSQDPVLMALDPVLGSASDPVLMGAIEALATLVEIRDRYESNHAQLVESLALKVGRIMGLEPGEAQLIAGAARLRDVGKVAIPDAVLQQQSRLSEYEWSLIRTHPEVGAALLARVPPWRDLAAAVRDHHERWDGQGYPAGLAADQIPLSARILAVVDAYAALVSERPYRRAMHAVAALVELSKGAGSQFDPAVVEALKVALEEDASPEAEAQAG